MPLVFIISVDSGFPNKTLWDDKGIYQQKGEQQS